MKQLYTSAALLMFLLCSGCGGDTRESLADEGVDKMQEMVDVLKGVTDASSAKSAGPKIKALTQEMEAISARGDKLPEPTADELKEIEAGPNKRMEAVSQKFMQEIERISRDPAMLAEMGEIDSDMR